MKRRVIGILLCMVMTASLLAGCGSSQGNDTSTEDQTADTAQDEASDQETEDETEGEAVEIVLSAADATMTGQGINVDSEVVDTVYVEDLKAVTNVGTDSTITYTVPEGTEGSFDIYLDISKSPYAAGTTPVSIIVNDQKEYVMPVALVTCAQDYSDLFSMGKFLMAENIAVKAGDTLTIIGKAGFEMEYGGNMVSSMPSIGDMYLYETGTPVAVGYDGGVVREQEEVDAADPLSGLKLVWLGSSVTFGAQSGGYSMADEIQEKHAATKCLKYAISGTTLVNESGSSYVERMKDIDPDMDMDLLIVQLSTNDATQGKALGSLSESENLEDFDDTTIIGAMEYIIAYARATWDCPVVFYSGSYYESEALQ